MPRITPVINRTRVRHRPALQGASIIHLRLICLCLRMIYDHFRENSNWPSEMEKQIEKHERCSHGLRGTNGALFSKYENIENE